MIPSRLLQFGSILEILKMTVSFVLQIHIEPAEPWYALHAYGTQSGQNFAEKETISKNFNLSKTKPKIQVQFFYIFYKSEMKLKTSSRQWLVDKGSPIHLGPLPILSLIDLDNE